MYLFTYNRHIFTNVIKWAQNLMAYKGNRKKDQVWITDVQDHGGISLFGRLGEHQKTSQNVFFDCHALDLCPKPATKS